MKLYRKYIVWCRQGIKLSRRFCNYEFSETKPQDEYIQLTWDNLDEFYDNYGYLAPFTIWDFKKLRIIEFWEGSLFCSKEYRSISSKKYPNLPLTCEIVYEETNNISIKDILEIAPAEKAIKYLQERGLEIKN